MKFKLVETIVEEKKKQKYKTYTNGINTIKILADAQPPEGYYEKKRVPWNKGLTAETDPRVKANAEKTHKTRKEKDNYSAWNKGLTAETDERVAKNAEHTKATIKAKYGVDNISQYLAQQPDYKIWNAGLTAETDERMKKASDNHKGCTAWNKGLTAEIDDRVKCYPRSAETREKIRQSHLTPEVQFKRFETMRKNGTLGHNQDTAAEKEYLNELLKLYSLDDIEHPYIDKKRYPFKCDFYIKSQDLFIEVHGNWTHGGRPFDESDPDCLAQLEVWKEKAKTSDYYKNAIYTWTDLDVRKLQIATTNNLNFKVIYYK